MSETLHAEAALEQLCNALCVSVDQQVHQWLSKNSSENLEEFNTAFHGLLQKEFKQPFITMYQNLLVHEPRLPLFCHHVLLSWLMRLNSNSNSNSNGAYDDHIRGLSPSSSEAWLQSLLYFILTKLSYRKELYDGTSTIYYWDTLEFIRTQIQRFVYLSLADLPNFMSGAGACAERTTPASAPKVVPAPPPVTAKPKPKPTTSPTETKQKQQEPEPQGDEFFNIIGDDAVHDYRKNGENDPVQSQSQSQSHGSLTADLLLQHTHESSRSGSGSGSGPMIHSRNRNNINNFMTGSIAAASRATSAPDFFSHVSESSSELSRH